MQQNSDTRKTEFDVARKLLTNSDFTNLHNRLNRFNVFEAFGHNEKEPRHTELLRYFLDPHETHGLGDAMLRNVLLMLCNDSTQLADELFMLDIGATDVDSQNSKNGRRIDIKVEIPYRCQNTNPLHILIEMKIRAQQGEKQLSNYSKDYEDIEEKILVYLTLNEEDSVPPEWLNLTYDDLILPALESTIKAFEDKLDPEILGLLKNYYEVLESLTKEEDSERAEIVEKILKEIDTKKINWEIIKKLPVMRPYRRAIDELNQRALEIEKTPMLSEFRAWCKKNHKEYSSNESYMRFLPSSLGGDTNFIDANSNLAGFDKGKLWIQPPAAIIFEIFRSGSVDAGDADVRSTKVRCQITLGPLKAEIDRDFCRTELRKILNSTGGKSTNVYSKIGEIGKPEEFEEKIKTIDIWLKDNQDKLEEIKQFILGCERKVKECLTPAT